MGSGMCQEACPPSNAVKMQEEIVNDVASMTNNQYKLKPIIFDDPDQGVRLFQQKVQKLVGQDLKNMEKSQIGNQKENFVIISHYKGKSDRQIEGLGNFVPIQVPFSVIKITMPPKMIENIKHADPSFFEKHSDKMRHLSNNWKLLEQGCYVNLMKGQFGVFISSKQFYQGYYHRNRLDIYQPHGNGLLITEFSTYQGNFVDGAASGKGKYTMNQTSFEGIWQKGRFINGSIETFQFIYHGELDGKLPHGKGKLKYKKKNIFYQGFFKNGKFEDKDGIYESETHSYRGQFKNGKKHGIGTLTEKEQFIKEKKKYYPPLKIHGQWDQDTFLDKENLFNIKSS